jgi:integrase
MPTGIVKRHSRSCRSHGGGRCNCDPSWQAWVYLKRDGRKIKRAFRREADAKTWRTDALVALSAGTLRPARRDSRTLSLALTEFVAGMVAGTVRPKGRGAYKPNTVRSYDRAVRSYIEPSALGRLKVADVRRRDVQVFADELLGSGLAPATVWNVLNPIQTFYRRAIDRDELAYNPAARIDLPAPTQQRSARIAAPGEAAALLAALPEADRPLWAAAFYAGLRRGELMGLRCLDVDLGRSLIRIERSWDQVAGPIEPKSEKGRRAVPLLAVLRDYLDEHMIGADRSGDALVFGRTAEQPFAPMTVHKRARRAWDAGNSKEREAAENERREPRVLDPITLHECRHTFASLLIDAGTNPKSIQEYMGHATIAVTFDVYGHLMPGNRDEVRERMDAYLARFDHGAIEASELHE